MRAPHAGNSIHLSQDPTDLGPTIVTFGAGSLENNPRASLDLPKETWKCPKRHARHYVCLLGGCSALLVYEVAPVEALAKRSSPSHIRQLRGSCCYPRVQVTVWSHRRIVQITLKQPPFVLRLQWIASVNQWVCQVLHATSPNRVDQLCTPLWLFLRCVHQVGDGGRLDARRTSQVQLRAREAPVVSFPRGRSTRE